MAGHKGMHKKLLNPAAMEVIRAKIKSEQIINKLNSHILDDIEMTSSQVSAALGLLKKTTPDLSAIEHSGELDHTLTVEIVRFGENTTPK